MSLTDVLGARVQRMEDPRLLRGDTNFIEGMSLPAMASVAFVRSTWAHARIKSIDTEKASALPGVLEIVIASDIEGACRPIRVDWPTPTHYRPCDQPAIAEDTVRFVGEIVAAVVAEDRYVAEDAVDLIEVEYEDLPVVANAAQALQAGAPILHADWADNLMYASEHGGGDVETAFASAHETVSVRLQMARQGAVPMEGRAVLAAFDRAQQELTVWTSSQMPHMVRSKLAQWLDLPENDLRVISPDVGGGFGLKCHIFPEEMILTLLARRLRRPVKWIEDRAENLTASFQAKEETIAVELALAEDGEILGMKADFLLDGGAYAGFPWTPAAEASMAAMAAPGPYRINNIRTTAKVAVTNKPVSSVYRGVGVPAACFAMEHSLDLAASKLGIDPIEIRRRNILARSDFPHWTLTGYLYDSASPRESLDAVVEQLDYEAFRREQARARSEGRYLGIGFASMMELTAFGHAGMLASGMHENVGGYDAAHLRMDPGGKATLAVGTLSHGQSHRTTYAQLVSSVLGCEPSDVRVVQGDTARTPFGWGTWGSRSAVAGGGAVLRVSREIREKLLRVGAPLLEASPEDAEIAPGVVRLRGAPERSISLAEVCRAAIYRSIVPAAEAPGLEATASYKAPSPFTNATHVAIVEVDPDIGAVKVQRYLVNEDCGTMINPMVVEGQITGGVAQGIGGALLEEFRYDENGQLLSGSLMDYLLPTACDVPSVEISHLETPSPDSEEGIKGMAEGGAVAPLPAVANAVSDALSPLVGWKPIERLPITHERLFRFVRGDAR